MSSSSERYIARTALVRASSPSEPNATPKTITTRDRTSLGMFVATHASKKHWPEKARLMSWIRSRSEARCAVALKTIIAASDQYSINREIRRPRKNLCRLASMSGATSNKSVLAPFTDSRSGMVPRMLTSKLPKHNAIAPRFHCIPCLRSLCMESQEMSKPVNAVRLRDK